MSKILELKSYEGIFNAKNIPHIPNNVEELVIDSWLIGDNAFEDFEELHSLTLLNTRVIGEFAFRGCGKLREVKLPDTLLEICNGAFLSTDIAKITIPTSVTWIGRSFISNVEHIYPDVEIFLKDEKSAPFFIAGGQRWNSVRLTVRSLETGEMLARFLTGVSLDSVLTDHGIDHAGYDRELKAIKGIIDTTIRYGKIYGHYDFVGKDCLDRLRTRLDYPFGLSERSAADFKEALTNGSAGLIAEMINDKESPDKFENFEYYDEIDNEKILKLISFAAAKNYPEAGEKLIKAVYKRLDRSEHTDRRVLKELIDHSARLGLTEITAKLMQRLHELGNNGNSASQTDEL